MTPSGSEIQVNGVPLYYDEYGERPAIVGIHGAAGSAAFWSGDGGSSPSCVAATPK